MQHLLAHLAAAQAVDDLLGTFLVFLLPLPVIAAANWNQQPPAGEGLAAAMGRFLGIHLFWPLLGLAPGACAVLGLFTLAALPTTASPAAGGRLAGYVAILLLTALVAASLMLQSTRDRLARLIPIDPRSPVDTTALVLSTVVVGLQIGSQVAIDVLAQQARSGPQLGPLDLVGQEVPFLLAALLGVGLFIRRGPRSTLTRLGLVRPSGWQLVLALAAAGIFYAFGNGVDMLSHMLTPTTAAKVDAANQRLFGSLGNPVGIATIALSAGICEEALFRGAMQPRLGVLWTSLVFAAVHSQYGLSLDAIAVFVLAIGLGLLRRVANTTTTTICHVTYNTLVGVGVIGIWLVPALAVEVVLVFAGITGLLTGRLGSLRTAQ